MDKLRERFEAKFIPEPMSGCWLWNASASIGGYGRISVNRKCTEAHRVSYRLYVGEIPEGSCVLHRCDNPPCVNPGHLFVGSRATNNKDRKAKGRSAVGERHARSRFTVAEVLAIRADSRPIRKIGKEYGVGHGVISLIKNRRRWEWLT